MWIFSTPVVEADIGSSTFNVCSHLGECCGRSIAERGDDVSNVDRLKGVNTTGGMVARGYAVTLYYELWSSKLPSQRTAVLAQAVFNVLLLVPLHHNQLDVIE